MVIYKIGMLEGLGGWRAAPCRADRPAPADQAANRRLCNRWLGCLFGEGLFLRGGDNRRDKGSDT